MSIESEILRIQHNIADTYAAVSSKGGNVPLQPNSANLAAAVASIPTDTTVLVNAPIGSILNWSGTEADVPTGWHICNGEDGTLDLRDKFVLGAGTTHPVGDTGGSEEVTLTVGQMPRHGHLLGLVKSGNAGGSYNYPPATSSASTVSNANDAITMSGSSQPHSNMPPYYALLFIQKISATPTDYVTKAELEDYTPSEVYSTEEKQIGTWIDGKPVYRRVWSVTVEQCIIETNIIDLDIEIDTLTRQSAIIKSKGGTAFRSLTLTNTGGDSGFDTITGNGYVLITGPGYTKDPNKVKLKLPVASWAGILTLVLEYTKA